MHHLINLLGHSWDAMTRATSTSTLGFVLWTLAITAIGWGAPIAGRWLILKRAKHDRPFRKALNDSFWPSVFLAGGVIALVLVTFGAFILRTVFNDHQTFVMQNKTLRADNATLHKELEWRKHNISTTDPVSYNIEFVLRVFETFKRDMNGAPCLLYVSAPKETVALASEIGRLGGMVSGCSGVAPIIAENPELDEDLINGMVSDAIVVHAMKGERAADNLLMTLGDQIKLQRSYRLLPKGRWFRPGQKQRLVWLQFGNNVKWKSELSRRRD